MRDTGVCLKPFWSAMALWLSLASGQAVIAQGAAPSTGSGADPAAALRALEPAAEQEYQLGGGDEISVDVNGRPELSGKHVLGPDGRITLPVAGEIQVEGKTRAQAAKAIEAALSTYYQNITVSLSVDRYTSNHVLVFGAVEHAGLMTFDDTPSLLEVISRSGLPARAASLGANPGMAAAESFAQVPVPEQCIIYRQGEAVLTVQLRKLLQDGDARANMRLNRNDIVFIPGSSPYVSVLGNVYHPGLVRLDVTSTLPQILAQSGGLLDKSGRYPKILIVHSGDGAAAGTAGTMEVVSFKEILEAKPTRVTLRSGDIIYVPESGVNRAADSLQKISPLLTLITLGALLN